MAVISPGGPCGRSACLHGRDFEHILNRRIADVGVERGAIGLEQCAREGAAHRDHLIEVTEKAFDDPAAGTDDKANRRMSG